MPVRFYEAVARGGDHRPGINDILPRIREHKERQEKLEMTADEARTLLLERREVLDDVDTITAYAQDMRDFLKESDLTESKAFIKSFVMEVGVVPGKAVIRYSIPMPQESRIPGRDTEEVALTSPVLSTVHYGGPKWIVGGTVFEMWLGSL